MSFKPRFTYLVITCIGLSWIGVQLYFCGHLSSSRSWLFSCSSLPQQEWADGLIAIGHECQKTTPSCLDAEYDGKLHVTDEIRQMARDHIHKMYGYDKTTPGCNVGLGNSCVLFKPTLAKDDQFRFNDTEALSYFVTGIIPEDKGFALTPWIEVEWFNKGWDFEGRTALVMGNYFFYSPKYDEPTKVEYSFGYHLDENDVVKIHLHHSSAF